MIGAELQMAVYSALVWNWPAIAGGRIYDEPPGGATFPYIVIGDEQAIDDGNSCQDGWEVFFDVVVWSRPAAGSFAEAKTIAATVVETIVAMTTVTGFQLSHIEHVQNLPRREPDGGKTRQVICQFRALIDPA